MHKAAWDFINHGGLLSGDLEDKWSSCMGFTVFVNLATQLFCHPFFLLTQAACYGVCAVPDCSF